MVEAGADGVKVGMVRAPFVPLVSLQVWCSSVVCRVYVAKALKGTGIPLIADGVCVIPVMS